jgi:serine/threonine protein kinase
MAESMNLGASSCSSIASQSTHRHSFSTKTIRVTQEPQRDPFSLDNVDYLNFLRRLGGQNVSFIPKENIERSSDDAYGAGATMIAYPGAWYRDREDSKTPEVVVVKYCNDRIPQGASTMPGFVNAMNSRFKAICQELDVMAGMEGRYYNNFPRLFGVCWEDVLSPAGIHLYRPILVMEAAISDLEMYVRGGGLENAQRHQDEKRFVSSILLAMNFLHQECNLVHGDLKPSNILVFQDKQTEMAELKLADFGFAYEITGYSPGGKDPEKFSQGTPYWAAPEMYPDDMWSFLTSPGLYTRDYYSFGLVVWFILFGYPVGDLKNGLTQEDEKVFKEIKQAGMISFKYDDLNSQEQRETYGTGLRPSIQDMLKQQFESRWKWGISGPCAIDEFKKIEEAEYAEDEDSSEEGDDEIEEILGKMMQKLMSEGKVCHIKQNKVY